MRACVHKSFPLCDYNFECDFKFGDASNSQGLYNEYVRWDSVIEQMSRRGSDSGNMVYKTHTHWNKRFIFTIKPGLEYLFQIRFNVSPVATYARYSCAISVVGGTT